MDALWPVEVLEYNATVKDAFGNLTDSWSDTARIELVFGWYPAGTTENTDQRETVTTNVELLVPNSFTVDPRDHIRILGAVYEVNGEIEDYNHGPFAFRPGGQVHLRRFST